MLLFREMFYHMVSVRKLCMITLLTAIPYMLKTYTSPMKMKVMIKLQMAEDIKIFEPNSLKKIDWHNYTQINYEKIREGIGEHGVPAHLLPKDSALEKRLYKVNNLNAALSDKIALNRSLPDIRHPGCASRLYIESLPSVSVVVPFYNEHWSTLLRTVYSVLNRSPPQLIKEIFLVDDASTKGFLSRKLDDYLTKNIPKVKVVRLKKRKGLINAKLAGAAKATADVLIFLDSHTEANVNWLPPLLEPIALNYRTAVCPFIDVIDYDTFEYSAQDEGARGAFDWDFTYARLPVLPKDEQNMPEPFESPVMSGGLFAISRKFFLELGGYDPGLNIWGGEQYELSFKIWQCGGRLLDAPCSRVGHIYPKKSKLPNPNYGGFLGKNYRRVADVWMDGYAEFLYRRKPEYRAINPGDLTERKALREALKCKTFKWFMTQVAFDLPFTFPPLTPNPYANGRIKPQWNRKLCIEVDFNNELETLVLSECKRQTSENEFVFSWYKDIRLKKRNLCWDLPNSVPRSKVELLRCHSFGGNQMWRYQLDTKHITHGSGNCLDYERDSLELFINRCDENSITQQWRLEHIDFAAMRTWDNKRMRPTGPLPEL